MELYTFLVKFFREGGVFLYPLALVFAVGVAIAIERFIYLTKETIGNRGLWDDLIPHLQSGNFKATVARISESNASIGTVLKYGMARVSSARRRDDIEKAMEEGMLEIIPRLEKRTHYLATLANIGMLMGLLGTVIGLISAFGAVAMANPAEKASLLAASISVAMNNTASGLIVAITLLLSSMFLETKTTRLIDSLEIAAVKFLNAVTERSGGDGPAPAATAPRGASPRMA